MAAMDRRQFLEVAGSAALTGGEFVRSVTGAEPHAAFPSNSPRDVKINIKPLYAGMVHSGVWVGPCRPKKTKPPEQERASHRKRFPAEIEKLRATVASMARLRTPLCSSIVACDSRRSPTDWEQSARGQENQRGARRGQNAAPAEMLHSESSWFV